MGYATHLVTLAHRVSGIHTRYAKIHSLSVAFSLGRAISRIGRRNTAEFCRHQSQLTALNEELLQIASSLQDGSKLEPSTTLGDEFRLVLGEYIEALSNTVQSLGRICAALCREKQAAVAYDERQSRADRLAYDESIQHYRRLGERLSQLYQRL
jgi:hypothetical protein